MTSIFLLCTRPKVVAATYIAHLTAQRRSHSDSSHPKTIKASVLDCSQITKTFLTPYPNSLYICLIGFYLLTARIDEHTTEVGFWLVRKGGYLPPFFFFFFFFAKQHLPSHSTGLTSHHFSFCISTH